MWWMDLGLKPAVQLVMNRIPLNNIHNVLPWKTSIPVSSWSSLITQILKKEFTGLLVSLLMMTRLHPMKWTASHKMTQMDLGLNPVYSCRSPQSSPSDPQAGCSRTKWWRLDLWLRCDVVILLLTFVQSLPHHKIPQIVLTFGGSPIYKADTVLHFEIKAKHVSIMLLLCTFLWFVPFSTTLNRNKSFSFQ